MTSNYILAKFGRWFPKFLETVRDDGTDHFTSEDRACPSTWSALTAEMMGSKHGR